MNEERPDDLDIVFNCGVNHNKFKCSIVLNEGNNHKVLYRVSFFGDAIDTDYATKEIVDVLNEWLTKDGNKTKLIIYNQNNNSKIKEVSFFIKICHTEQDIFLESVDQIKKLILEISLNYDIETLIEQISSYDPTSFLDILNKEFQELNLFYNRNFYYSYHSLLNSQKSNAKNKALKVIVCANISENFIYSPNYKWAIFERVTELFKQHI